MKLKILFKKNKMRLIILIINYKQYLKNLTLLKIKKKILKMNNNKQTKKKKIKIIIKKI